ncbi:MAG: hypothetical protein KGQ41_06395 [Alphaproteobacteria bacterium]|nr:hypothetical protein [Alphaproteobacteria bacterium]
MLMRLIQIMMAAANPKVEEPAPANPYRHQDIRALATLYSDTRRDTTLERDEQIERMVESFSDAKNGEDSMSLFGGLLLRALYRDLAANEGKDGMREIAINIQKVEVICGRLKVALQRPPHHVPVHYVHPAPKRTM